MRKLIKDSYVQNKNKNNGECESGTLVLGSIYLSGRRHSLHDCHDGECCFIQRLGLSNTQIALYTSWLYLPWVIKPLWSPFVDIFRTKRFWILAMQLAIGASLACVALTLPAANFVRYTLAMFWIMAFSSATHDIAADGYYMLALDTPQQAAFVGVRVIFYRVATIAAKADW